MSDITGDLYELVLCLVQINIFNKYKYFSKYKYYIPQLQFRCIEFSHFDAY